MDKEYYLNILTNSDILQISCGEVIKQDTNHYVTLKPIIGGLFCPKIFGNCEDYKCYCGKYEGIEFKDITCNKCGTTVGPKTATRYRAGSIKLAVPIPFKHIVIPLFKIAFGLGSKISLAILDGSIKFKFQKGVLLMSLDENALSGSHHVYETIKNVSTSATLKNMPHIIERFPTWGDLWMHNYLILPAGLRPQITKPGTSTIISHPLNRFYATLVSKNNRSKKLLLQAQYAYIPQQIIDQELNDLQITLNSLYDDSGNISKNISETIGSKTGLIRGYILGKRVDFSARSVITPNPYLKSHQVIVPRNILHVLFQLPIRRQLFDLGIFTTSSNYQEIIDENTKTVDDILVNLSKKYKIIINRNPTLFQYGLQAMEFLIGSNQSIGINTLVCHALGADFDGDEMHLFLNFTEESQKEIQENMFRKAIFNNANSSLMLLLKNELRYILYKYTKIANTSEAIELPHLNYFSSFYYQMEDFNNIYLINGKYYRHLTLMIFSYLSYHGFHNYNFTETLTEQCIYKICYQLIETNQVEVDTFIDYVKDILFEIVGYDGSSTTIKDLDVLYDQGYIKEQINDVMKKNLEIKETSNMFSEQNDHEAHNVNLKQQKNWNVCYTNIQKHLQNKVQTQDDNAFLTYILSRARGSMAGLNFTVGLKGLTVDLNYQLSYVAVTSNLFVGSSAIEFLMASSEGRKNFSSKTTRAAADGYFCRKLVYSAFNTVIKGDDCGSTKGVYLRQQDALRKWNINEGKYVTEEDIENNPKKYIYARSPLYCRAELHNVCRKCAGNNIYKLKDNDAIGIVSAQALAEPGSQLAVSTKKGEVNISADLSIFNYTDIPIQKGLTITVAEEATTYIDNQRMLLRDIMVKIQDDNVIVKIITLLVGSILPAINKPLAEDSIIKSNSKHLITIAPIDGKVTIKDNVVTISNELNSYEANIENNLSFVVEDGSMIKAGELICSSSTQITGSDQLSAYDTLKRNFEGINKPECFNSIIPKDSIAKRLYRFNIPAIKDEIKIINPNQSIFYIDFIKSFGIDEYVNYICDLSHQVYKSANLNVSRSSIEVIIRSLINFKNKNGTQISWYESFLLKHPAAEFLALLNKPITDGWLIGASFQRSFMHLVNAAIYNTKETNKLLFSRVFMN